MARYTFTHRQSWSDHPDGGHEVRGQLPGLVRLPDGERISLDLGDYDERDHEPSRAGYIQLHANVRVKYTFWGDDGTRRSGRNGGKVEVLAPKGSTFLFVQRCPLCGEPRGYVSENGLQTDMRAPPNWHEDCAREVYEQERLAEYAELKHQQDLEDAERYQAEHPYGEQFDPEATS